MCSEKKIQESRTPNKTGYVFIQVREPFLNLFLNFNFPLNYCTIMYNTIPAGFVHYLVKSNLIFFFFFFRQHFGCDHPKYADTLIDYGYYLLNVDAINLSVKVYKVSISLEHCKISLCLKLTTNSD